jgi:hypothetical protein
MKRKIAITINGPRTIFQSEKMYFHLTTNYNYSPPVSILPIATTCSLLIVTAGIIWCTWSIRYLSVNHDYH